MGFIAEGTTRKYQLGSEGKNDLKIRGTKLRDRGNEKEEGERDERKTHSQDLFPRP
jgi:hypothetical protein